uniref:hypothetical protein n=1 Tax=Pseudonocardia sp. CA-138482 TaxID=3240023 RepID=UPI003F49A749
MAFPTVVSQTPVQIAAAASYTVTMPAGGTNGDLWLVVADIDATHTPATTSTGWTRIGVSGTGAGTSFGAFGGIKGTASTSLVLTNGSITVVCQTNTFIITGWAGVVANIGFADFTNSSTADATPNPPALTPTGGAQDYLWIVNCSLPTSATGAQPTTAPTNYTNLLISPTSGSGSASIGNLATAWRNLNAATEDPGTFSGGTSNLWSAETLAIPPAASVAAPAQPLRTTPLVPRLRSINY